MTGLGLVVSFTRLTSIQELEEKEKDIAILMSKISDDPA